MLNELEAIVDSAYIRHKQWLTGKGIIKGGKKLKTSALHRMLHEKLYLGYIENKRTGQSFKGQHEAIITKDLWDKVQTKLKENDRSSNHSRNKNDNLLTGKMFDTSGTAFINQANSKKGITKKRYYAVKGLFLPTDQIDKLTKEAVTEILNCDLSSIDNANTLFLKQINFTAMDYFQQRDFIRDFINKIVYSENKLVFFFNPDNGMLSKFTGTLLNQATEKLKFINDTTNNQIIYEKRIVINRGLSSNIYNAGKVGLMSINDNNRLIVRTFAYAWKYKKMYEKGITTNEIAEREKISKRTIYKYLSLAYLSPNIVNSLLSGTQTINLQKLFEIASKNLSFEEQEMLLSPP